MTTLEITSSRLSFSRLTPSCMQRSNNRLHENLEKSARKFPRLFSATVFSFYSAQPFSSSHSSWLLLSLPFAFSSVSSSYERRANTQSGIQIFFAGKLRLVLPSAARDEAFQPVEGWGKLRRRSGALATIGESDFNENQGVGGGGEESGRQIGKERAEMLPGSNAIPAASRSAGR